MNMLDIQTKLLLGCGILLLQLSFLWQVNSHATNRDGKFWYQSSLNKSKLFVFHKRSVLNDSETTLSYACKRKLTFESFNRNNTRT